MFKNYLREYNELTCGRFQKNYDNVHQVIVNRNYNSRAFTDKSMAMPNEALAICWITRQDQAALKGHYITT